TTIASIYGSRGWIATSSNLICCSNRCAWATRCSRCRSRSNIRPTTSPTPRCARSRIGGGFFGPSCCSVSGYDTEPRGARAEQRAQRDPVLDGAPGRPIAKIHHVVARRHVQGAQRDVGRENRRALAVDFGLPPRIERIAHDEIAVARGDYIQLLIVG